MTAALNILGIPCYHSFILFSQTRDLTMWNAALDAKLFHRGSPFKRSDWDSLLGHHGAVADAPAILFTEDLLAAYPNCKVILVERDIEKWYTSFDDTVIANTWNPLMQWLRRRGAWMVGPIGDMNHRWFEGWMGAHNRDEMRENARECYKRHYRHVREVVPKERLLEYKLGSGWEPLCAFLGRPVPEVPFPHVNETQALNEMLGLLMRRSLMDYMIRVMRVVVPVVVLGVAVWLY
jgi:hypothetical protein